MLSKTVMLWLSITNNMVYHLKCYKHTIFVYIWPKRTIFIMPKRKRKTEFNERVRQAMLVPGASDRACIDICEIMSGEKQASKFYKLKTSFLQPFRQCLQEISLEASEGEPVPFLVGTPQKLLQQFCKTEDYSKLLDESLQRHCGKLTFCLYHDDCIAGNVLGPLKQSKCTLYYGSFLESLLCLIVFSCAVFFTDFVIALIQGSLTLGMALS